MTSCPKASMIYPVVTYQSDLISLNNSLLRNGNPQIRFDGVELSLVYSPKYDKLYLMDTTVTHGDRIHEITHIDISVFLKSKKGQGPLFERTIERTISSSELKRPITGFVPDLYEIYGDFESAQQRAVPLLMPAKNPHRLQRLGSFSAGRLKEQIRELKGTQSYQLTFSFNGKI
ncbi:hypothetical protein KY306_01330 [Candidatus Woesearchaeota archaeon]|nr:hypothetical protein [Candidatus Woesearchaeota archaeon]